MDRLRYRKVPVIKGTVTIDGGSGAIDDVTVTLKQFNETIAETEPDANGNYIFEGVLLGYLFTVEAALQDYTTASSEAFNIESETQVETFDLKLEPSVD